MNSDEIDRLIEGMDSTPLKSAWHDEAVEALRQLQADNQRLKAALQLARDMFTANDLDLPHTFEVIDAALGRQNEAEEGANSDHLQQEQERNDGNGKD